MRSFCRLTAGIVRQVAASQSSPREPGWLAAQCRSLTAGSIRVEGQNGWLALTENVQAAGSFRAASVAAAGHRCREGALWGRDHASARILSLAQIHPPWSSLKTISTAATPGWGSLASAAESSTSPLVTPVRSPLLPGRLGTGAVSGSAAGKPVVGRAILTGIKQSPKKINLVAALVRGMRVEDALAQLAVSTKRAAVTMAKLVHAAKANGVTNHGMAEPKLFIAEAFVGKDKYLKRIFMHGRGKSGVRERPRSMLTVIVKEMSPKQEGILAKAYSFHWSKRRPSKLVPHRLITVGQKKVKDVAGSKEGERIAAA